MSKYNWKGDGTPGGCDNHCIPHPCGPCITGKYQPDYNLDYFIDKFEAIDEDLWITGNYELQGKCCAFGHCGIRADDITGNPNKTEEALALKGLTPDIVAINDGLNDLANYAPTPKQRVLKHLRALKHMSEKTDA